jgi:hypothetical protein
MTTRSGARLTYQWLGESSARGSPIDHTKFAYSHGVAEVTRDLGAPSWL